MKQIMRIKAVLLWTVAVLGVVVLVAFSQQQEQQSETVLDYDAYQDLMFCKVADIYDLEEWFFLQQDFWMLLLPPDPDFILRQSGSPAVLPFDWKDFPTDFVENLTWEYENSVPVYPITILEDPATHETVFLNGDGKEIYSLPPADDYDPYAFLNWMYPDLYSGSYSRETVAYFESLYDPARVWIETKLIPAESVELYLYTAARIREEAQKDDEDGGGDGMLLRFGEDYTNYLWVGIQGPAQGLTNIEIAVNIPDGFTSRVEIFTCTNLLDSWWTLAATNISTEGTNVVYWTYDLSGDDSPVFFAAGNADIDSDGDGLTDAREKFLYHTDPNEWDTDGDGFSDGDEVNVYGTDPLDKYSVPAPQMLGTDGKYIVDESGNPVVLRSVNIGGWLAFEQWMVKFLPRVVTNMIGQVTDDHMPEATLKEILVDNVDSAVTRLATNQNGYASGVTNNPDGWTLSHVGSFGNGKWVRYDVDFGTGGVSRFSALLARGVSGGNPQINVRLESVGGPLVGRLPVADTGGWYVWSEQTIALWSNVVGVQTVYLVGASSSGDIGNMHRVRFYRDDNTRGLFDTFRDNYFTTNDLDNLKALGYNCLRVPFLYDLIQDGTGTNYLEEGWARLDWVIDECRKRHMWVILDLHGTPGAQNGSDHSGKPKGLGNRLWNSVEYRNRLAHLWKTVAARYATNSAVAGYDLFNEPDPEGAGTKTAIYSNSILPVLDQVYKAIRSNDTQHLVFMMSSFMYTNMWNDVWSCPAPASKGWTNVVYQFHHYDRIVYGGTGSGDFDFENQKPIADEIVRTYTRFSDAKNVPVFIGEFMPVEMPNFDYFIRRFEANNIHWAHWNFRHWGHDDSARPWSSWGLDYRIGGIYQGTNTAIQPNVRTDSLSTLSGKLADYTRTNYAAHPHLPKIVKNNALSANKARERTEFYLNTFSGPDVQDLNHPNAWPWRKVSVLGASNTLFRIQNQAARLLLERGPIVLRARSREEADARFELNDDAGCWFSVDSVGFNVTNNQAGYDAAINLCAVRDEITSRVFSYDTKGVIARLEYDKTGDALRISVYAKNGGTNTFGTQLQQISGIGFAGGAALALFVNRTNASVIYNGTNLWTGAHGLNLDSWADGAVFVVEAEQVITNTTQFADLDNIRAERPGAAKGLTFSDDFSSYATGIVARAEPELLALRRWTNAAAGDSIMTNSALIWIPQSVTNGGSWYGPKRDYHNDVSLDLSGETVAEVQVAYDAFSSSNFHAKIAVMPEYFTGEISNQYVGAALYLEMAYRLPPETNAGNLAFGVWRHTGPGTREGVALNDSLVFVPGQVVSFQVSTNWCEVYYGTNLLVSQEHGLTNATVLYADGLYPHLEIKNRGASVNLTAQVGDILCRQRSSFGVP